MNIYILVEISKREFDSNLLLAFLAAVDGHEVVLSNFENYLFLNSINKLKPGIFHTKSLVHGKQKKNFHKSIKKKNFFITSIDEEARLINEDLTSFSETRFDNENLEIVDQVFCWGNHDYEFLTKRFPTYKNKFNLSGSPRMDLSKKYFSKFWNQNRECLEKNILICLNFPLINGFLKTNKIYNELKKQGFFERSKLREKEYFEFLEDSKKSFEQFKDLINYLIEDLNDYNFVVRPHPMEKTETWNEILNFKENLKINNKNILNYDLTQSKLIIHNGCTSAFQAAIHDIPIISFKSYKSKSNHGSAANKVGKIITKKEDVRREIINIFKNKDFKLNEYINKDVLNFKVYLPQNKISGEIMVSAWKKIGENISFKKNNWKSIKTYLLIFKVIKFIKELILKIVYPFKKKTEYFYYKKKKFEDLDLEEVKNKIYKFKKLFQLEENVIVEKLSDKSFLVRKL